MSRQRIRSRERATSDSAPPAPTGDDLHTEAADVLVTEASDNLTTE